MLTISVNDRPIDVAPVVERGRVLLPLRAIFDALGATVGYDAAGSVVVARTPQHEVRLQIGSRTASVDGHPVVLDIQPSVIAARTYVPLRFVSQALGAVVGYDAATGLISITTAKQSVTSSAAFALMPPENASISTPYPTISASLGSLAASRTGIKLSVDGEDVTALSTFDGTTITYIPRRALSLGKHTVAFEGTTLQRSPFSEQWSFETTVTPPAESGVADDTLSNFAYRFYGTGLTSYGPGNFMHFTLIAPPGGSAYMQLCNLGYEYPLWNGGSGNTYVAQVQAPSGYWIPSCPVTAVYTAWNGSQFFVPIPVVVGLYTMPNPGSVAPTAAPSPAARGIEPMPRRSEPPAPRKRVPLPQARQTPGTVHQLPAEPRRVVPPPRPMPRPSP